ncbi:hypothetical protein BGZ99_004334, partial [Dissophora globulifera]
MHTINALELPEITEIIVGYLNNLEPCLTVCKAWRSLYLPYYWYEAKTGIQVSSTGRARSFDPIRHDHYRKFIRVLTVYNDLGPINQSFDYPNLRWLRLCCRRSKNWGKYNTMDPVLKDFVNRHPSLECLDLDYIPHLIMTPAWTALVNHPRLETMRLRCNRTCEKWLEPVPDGFYPGNIISEDFWRVCTRLRTLDFSGSVQGCAPKNLVMSSIRRLRLARLFRISLMNQLDIIVTCPLLEDLDWMQAESGTYPEWVKFGQLAAKGTWPHLQRLSIDLHIEDVDLSQVIASMHQATKIDISFGSFGPLSFAALQRHAGTLQHLSIPYAMDSQMNRNVLCTFTRLEYLKTGDLDAKDIAESGPWACTSLRGMSVMISFGSGEDSLQPMVFERVSRLVHLEVLENRLDYISGTEPRHGLSFRLQSGMAALASLSQLRRVEFDSDIQDMDVDDARWIIDHWKRLETLR